ncbi:MAG: hypothetical protein ACI9E1_000416 [Cryomorphaceae bacterium]|jgi:hypothetical protein
MVMRFAKSLCLIVFLLTIIIRLNAEEVVDGHFSSWENVPDLIKSISKNNYNKPLKRLTELTRVQLRRVQNSVKKAEDEIYLSETKVAWEKWWQTTGKPVSEMKNRDTEVDQEALDMAWKFLDTKNEKPKDLLPVWIPKTWRLCVTFTNGDYTGREKETWMIDRRKKIVYLTKLRGDYSKGDWSVTLTKHDGFTVGKADKTLRALCYLNRYAPAAGAAVSNNEMRTYYAGSRMMLYDGQKRILWDTSGYGFTKTRGEYGNAYSGRALYFLRTMFGDKKQWSELTEPTSNQLAPYRYFLSAAEPYFSKTSSEVVMLFGQHGGVLERESLTGWAKKQKVAINPSMDWRVYYGELKINVVNFTRLAFKDTVKNIKMMEKRIDHTAEQLKENMKLEQDVADMLNLDKQEAEADIMRHPQPLRDLIRVDRHPNDSDLKYLKASIEQIRKNPDPKLFKQLAAELDDGTVEMRMLFEHVLLDERGFLGMQSWGKKQEAIAINACIDALPIADGIGEIDDLITILLKVCGGGKIEYQGKNKSSSIEVKLTKNGYSAIYSGADNPLSVEENQNKLRRIYAESKKKK